MLIRCNHGCHCLYGNPADSHAIKSGSLPKSVGIRAIDVQTGVKHGNPADNQVEKSGHPPAILGVRVPGCPLMLYTVREYSATYKVLPKIFFVLHTYNPKYNNVILDR